MRSTTTENNRKSGQPAGDKPGTSKACCEPGSTGHHLTLSGDDKGILGNDFAMAQRLTVRPHEAAVYLPKTSGGGRKDVRHSVDSRSKGNHGGGLCSTSCRKVDTDPPHGEPSELDRLSHECKGDGDGGSRARPPGTVPVVRGGRGGPRHQDLAGQPRVATCGNRRGTSCCHG